MKRVITIALMLLLVLVFSGSVFAAINVKDLTAKSERAVVFIRSFDDKGREIALQIVVGGRDDGQFRVRIEQRAAVAGNMFDDADDTAVLQSAEDRTAQRRDAHRFAAERAVADHVARTRLANVQ